MQVKISGDLDVRRLISPDKAGKKERKGLCKATKHTKDIGGIKRRTGPVSAVILFVIKENIKGAFAEVLLGRSVGTI